MLLAKMVEFLKTEFLEAREVRPTLEQLLVMIQESEITDALKQVTFTFFIIIRLKFNYQSNMNCIF